MTDDKIARLRERLDRANMDCARLADKLAKARKRQAIVRRDLVKAKEAPAEPTEGSRFCEYCDWYVWPVASFFGPRCPNCKHVFPDTGPPALAIEAPDDADA